MRSATVALCMVVRDEAENLPACLRSVQGLATELWIVDTGSIDGTKEMALAFGANVLHFAWIDDFAAARNVGLCKAQAEWILVLDADERLPKESRQVISDVLQAEATERVAAFILPICSLIGDSGQGQEVSYNVRLFRNRPEHRYQGAVHEQILESIRAHNPERQIDNLPAQVMHLGYLPEAVRLKQKPARNLAIIERLLQQSPEDWYLQYHAAICLYNLGRFEESMARLQLVLESGPLQLNYAARCAKTLVVILRRLGRTTEALAVLDKYQHHWPTYTDLVYLRAQLFLDRGDLCRALDAAMACRLMGDAPPPFDSYHGLATFEAARLVGELAEGLGNKSLAEQAYGEIPAEQHEFVHCTARWLRLRCDRVGAIPAVMELTRRLPLPRDNALVADTCYLAGLYQPALQFMALAREDGDPAERSLFSGQCLFRLGRMDEAAASLRQVAGGHRLWATASLWLAYVALSQEAPASLAELLLSGQVPPENQEAYGLISFLLGGSLPVTAVSRLVLPLLRSVAPRVGAGVLQRCLWLVEQEQGYGQWVALASVLFRGYGQVDSAWQAYSHRPAGVVDPRLEAEMHQAQGRTDLAFRSYFRLLPHSGATVADFMQASRLCLGLNTYLKQGGEIDAD